MRGRRVGFPTIVQEAEGVLADAEAWGESPALPEGFVNQHFALHQVEGSACSCGRTHPCPDTRLARSWGVR